MSFLISSSSVLSEPDGERTEGKEVVCFTFPVTADQNFALDPFEPPRPLTPKLTSLLEDANELHSFFL